MNDGGEGGRRRSQKQRGREVAAEEVALDLPIRVGARETRGKETREATADAARGPGTGAQGAGITA